MESSELRRALLQACSDTVQVAVCVPADAAQHASALALVFWKPGGHVRIEVGSKEAPGGQTWTSREIDFSPTDDPLERWRAAGYAAGTLASLVVRGGSAPSTPAEEKPPSDAKPSGPATEGAAPAASSTATAPNTETKKAEPPPAPSRPAENPIETEQDEESVAHRPEAPKRATELWRWAMDASGTLGSGITVSHQRIGGLVRVSRAFGGPFITVSVGYAQERPLLYGVSTDWLMPSVGAGYVVPLSSWFTLEARAEIVGELLHGHAVDALEGDETTAYRWLAGARAGFGAAWAPFETLSLLVGGAVFARGPETDIVVRNLVQTTTSIPGYQLDAGLRFTLR